MKDIKLIIFDFDGTIADTKDIYVSMIADKTKIDKTLVLKYYNEYFEEEIQPSTANAKWLIIRGFYLISRRLGLNPISSLLVFLFFVKNYSNYKKGINPTVNCIEAILELSKKKKEIAIISLSNKRKITDFNKKHALDEYFKDSMIIGKEDVEKTKESAIMATLSKVETEIEKENCVIIGDLGGDIIAGKNVGIKTIGITTGFMSKNKLEKSEPDDIVQDLGELTDIIQ